MPGWDLPERIIYQASQTCVFGYPRERCLVVATNVPDLLGDIFP